MARALTALGLVATIAYLVWRAGFSMQGSPWWLALPFFAFELVGLLAAGVLAWALWPSPIAGLDEIDDDPAAAAAAATSIGLDASDVVVRVGGRPAHELRATLLALRDVRHRGEVVVLGADHRPDVAAVAAAFGARVEAAATEGHDLATLLAAVGTPTFLLLEAGEVPSPDIIGILGSRLADPEVAVVQGHGSHLGEEQSFKRVDRSRDPRFERVALNPALGRRGVAVWTGSGSLVRVAALEQVAAEVDSALSPLELCWHSTLELHAVGWKVVAAVTPVVAQSGPVDDGHVYADRVQRARAARRLVFAPGGALRPGGLPVRSRLAVLAWAVRPLSGLRRLVFVGLVCGVLLSGRLPFSASPVVLVAAWLPAVLYTSVGLGLLSGWTLRPGDRSRWSLHTIGAACTSLRYGPAELAATEGQVIALPSARFGLGLVVTSIVLVLAVWMRTVSELFTHALGAISTEALVAALAVTAWLLVLTLDLLRRLVHRGRMRSTPRVAASLPALLGDRGVTVVDLAATGAGLVGMSPVAVGQRLLLDTALPTRSGVSDLRLSCEVRNVSVLGPSEWRIGVSFSDVDRASADALAEFCAIEPVWERLGVVPGRSVTEARPIVFVPDPTWADDPPLGWSAVRQSNPVS